MRRLLRKPRYPIDGKPYVAIIMPPTVGDMVRIKELTAMFIPSIAPARQKHNMKVRDFK